VSSEILETIFRKVSPVHDGAAIIEGDRITRVAAILPLSQRRDLPRDWGTRHRAAFGLAERCDALVIVASEERGEVALMHDATFEQVEQADQLSVALRNLTLTPRPTPVPRFLTPKELRLQAIAIGLAAVIWTVTYLWRATP
jgi:diadenylate cyclase